MVEGLGRKEKEEEEKGKGSRERARYQPRVPLPQSLATHMSLEDSIDMIVCPIPL